MEEKTQEKSGIISMIYRKAVDYAAREKEYSAFQKDTLRDELIDALNHGDFQQAKLLLQAGANPNSISKAGESLLFQVNSQAAQLFLLENGADPNQPVLSTGLISVSTFKKGDTPLHQAVRDGDFEMLAQLIAAGGNVEIKNKDGLSVRALAVKEGCLREYIDALGISKKQQDARMKDHVSLSPGEAIEDKVQREAKAKLDSGVKEKPIELPGLIRKDFQYFDSADSKTPIITDRGSDIAVNGGGSAAIEKAVSLAKEKGWTSLKLEGTSKEQLSEAWLTCQVMGLKTEGYTPTTQDLAKLAERQASAQKTSPTLSLGSASEVTQATSEIKTQAQSESQQAEREGRWESPWFAARRAAVAKQAEAAAVSQSELEIAYEVSAVMSALKERYGHKLATTHKENLPYTGTVLESWPGIGFTQNIGGGHVAFHAHPNPPQAGQGTEVMYAKGNPTPIVGIQEIKNWREQQAQMQPNSHTNRPFEPTKIPGLSNQSSGGGRGGR